MSAEAISSEAKIQTYPMVESAREYLYRAIELGIVEGPVGSMQLSPEFSSLVSALHHLLGGGKVEVNVLEDGDSRVVGELDNRLLTAMKHSNEINAQSGVYMTATG